LVASSMTSFSSLNRPALVHIDSYLEVNFLDSVWPALRFAAIYALLSYPSLCRGGWSEVLRWCILRASWVIWADLIWTKRGYYLMNILGSLGSRWVTLYLLLSTHSLWEIGFTILAWDLNILSLQKPSEDWATVFGCYRYTEPPLKELVVWENLMEPKF
jgi:hypothetical protein